jgi:hypothetical protein
MRLLGQLWLAPLSTTLEPVRDHLVLKLALVVSIWLVAQSLASSSGIGAETEHSQTFFTPIP